MSPDIEYSYLAHGTKDDYLKRLRRIEGQVRGLQRMVEEDKYCIDILTQISAATKALQAVSLSLLDEHLSHCVVQAAKAGGGPSASSYVLRAAIAARGAPPAMIQSSVCVGDLKYTGQAQVQTDIANLKAAAEGQKVEELCLTAPAPPIMSYFLRNEHYKDDRDELFLAPSRCSCIAPQPAEAGVCGWAGLRQRRTSRTTAT